MHINATDLRIAEEIADKVEGLSAKTRLIPVEETEEIWYSKDPDAPNDTGHLLFFLKQRFPLVEDDGPYERVVYFADCADASGRVVCKWLTQPEDSMRYFKYTKAGGHGIGCFFLVEEYVFPCAQPLVRSVCPVRN